MRFIVLGAGAVGGVIGGRLFESGHEVVMVARGDHYAAIRSNGLQVDSPDRSVTLAVAVVDGFDQLELRADDVVFLTVKTQDSREAIRQLAVIAPPSVAVLCAQNGVESERLALRAMPNVYGMCVMFSSTYIEPGIVAAKRGPVTGILDIGRYPTGSDDVAEHVSAALRASTFVSTVQANVMRWKYAKLLLTLQNTIDAIFGPQDRSPENKDPIAQLARAARAEGVAAYHAAGIDFATDEEDATRRAELPPVPPGLPVAPAGQLSSWQSLARGTGSVEADYFNGEVVLLGRQHGVATPANAALQRQANEMAARRLAPGSISSGEFFDRWDGLVGQ